MASGCGTQSDEHTEVPNQAYAIFSLTKFFVTKHSQKFMLLLCLRLSIKTGHAYFIVSVFKVEEEMLMRKFYDLMAAQGLTKKVCLSS